MLCLCWRINWHATFPLSHAWSSPQKQRALATAGVPAVHLAYSPLGWCGRYVVWQEPAGNNTVGTRLLSLLSAFLYGLLTDRALLVRSTLDLDRSATCPDSRTARPNLGRFQESRVLLSLSLCRGCLLHGSWRAPCAPAASLLAPSSCPVFLPALVPPLIVLWFAAWCITGTPCVQPAVPALPALVVVGSPQNASGVLQQRPPPGGVGQWQHQQPGPAGRRETPGLPLLSTRFSDPLVLGMASDSWWPRGGQQGRGQEQPVCRLTSLDLCLSHRACALCWVLCGGCSALCAL